MLDVNKLVFFDRYIDVYLNDESASWRLALHPAVHGWMFKRRNMDADIAKLFAAQTTEIKVWTDRLTEEQARHVFTGEALEASRDRVGDKQSEITSLHSGLESVTKQIVTLRNELADERSKSGDLARLVVLREKEAMETTKTYDQRSFDMRAAATTLAHANAIAAYTKIRNEIDAARSVLIGMGDESGAEHLAVHVYSLNREIKRMTDVVTNGIDDRVGDEGGQPSVVPFMRDDDPVEPQKPEASTILHRPTRDG